MQEKNSTHRNVYVNSGHRIKPVLNDDDKRTDLNVIVSHRKIKYQKGYCFV